MRIGNVQTIPDVWARARILWNAIHQWRRSKCIPEKNRFVREFSSEAWLELTTILQLTQLKVLRVGDVLVRGQEEDDVALLVLDRDNVEQTVERASCFTIKNYKSLFSFFFNLSKSIVKKEIAHIIENTSKRLCKRNAIESIR